MGHNRLGTLPDTKPWRQVIAHIAEGDSARAVATATSRAASSGLTRGASDRGVAQVVFLLARAAFAARSREFPDRLDQLGIRVPADPTLFDLTVGFTRAMQSWYHRNRGTRTDLGEVAVLSANEGITEVVGERVTGLVSAGEDIHRTMRDFSTQNGFATLAHEFFARFVRRFLLYHLGRELSQHVGGVSRFADSVAYASFITELNIHCREAALIVRRYAGEWFEKHKVNKGITQQLAADFTSYALRRKLAPELKKREDRGG